MTIRRQWGTDRSGLFTMAYDCQGSGVMIDRSEAGWAFSCGIRGRGYLIGWIYLGRKPWQWKKSLGD